MPTPRSLVLSLLACTMLSTPVWAGGATPNKTGCSDIPRALASLGNPDKEYEQRSSAGICLLRYPLDLADVNRVALSILRDPSEDTLLREYLIEGFADANLRRRHRIEGRLAPALGKQERDAVDRTLAGVGSILEAAQAVKTIEEVVPSSRFEADFFRALSDIALDPSNHVILRATAVSALEKASVKIYTSGVFDEKTVSLVRDTLHVVATRDDDASYFTNAGPAYNRLAVAGLPGFSHESSLGAGRMLSSIKSDK